ncbi:response regulator transcription factor [Gilvimarinus sp. DA14]|uniref:response regulator transcription factor n=1 Tax=Gilvimarinus sp. DA14 TaxID=2956798 RepID=UPI0020B87C83|nr:response regulator transcription factor [Gilvimarinus sp. DA14]UTF61538.1 response regulator transcription factor [Gilvimarinus sp. DA14]
MIAEDNDNEYRLFLFATEQTQTLTGNLELSMSSNDLPIQALWLGETTSVFKDLNCNFIRAGWRVSFSDHVCSAGQLPLLQGTSLVFCQVGEQLPETWPSLQRQCQAKHCPIIVLAADRELCVHALRQGADDFLTTPINPDELMLRSQSLIRRLWQHPPVGKTRTLALGPLQLDTQARSAFYNQRPITLTAIQFKLLFCLAEQHNTLLRKADLHRRVLNKPYCQHDRSIDMHLSRVRKKLIALGMPTDAIQTVRGYGYQLSMQAACE